MRRGDDRSWSNFMRDYYGPSLAFLLSLRLSEHDAKDLLQEFFLKLSKNLAEYQKKEGYRFCFFLMICLRRKFYDFRKLAKNRLSVFIDDAPPDGISEGQAELERLAREDFKHGVESEQAVEESLASLLRDYPDQREKKIYLEWFWKDIEETDKEFASRNGLTISQFRYLREKVVEHLQKRAAETFEK